MHVNAVIAVKSNMYSMCLHVLLYILHVYVWVVVHVEYQQSAVHL